MNLTRRSFLQIGALPIFGINLLNSLRLLVQGDQLIKSDSPKSCIFFFLGGGISHIDTYDPKPEASLEIRGEYKTINTNIPGIYLSELLPEQAKIADKFTLIRSLTHDSDDHNFAERRIITGYSGMREPCFGSVSAKLLNDSDQDSVALPHIFLGSYAYNYYHGTNNSPMISKAYNPLYVSVSPNDRDFKIEELQIANGLTVKEFFDRESLRRRLDNLKLRLNHKISEADIYWQQAFEILTGGSVAQAFDIGEETRETSDDYGRTDIGQRALLARRLIEAGVKFVGIHCRGYGPIGWDYHNEIFKHMPIATPPFDQAIAALISDLDERGLLENTLVLAFGEFGRTPKINKNAGRDHWPKVGSVLMAGLNLAGGRVYGSSNSRGEEVKEKPISPQDLLATIYQLLGFPPDTRLYEASGRGHFITEGVPITL